MFVFRPALRNIDGTFGQPHAITSKPSLPPASLQQSDKAAFIDLGSDSPVPVCIIEANAALAIVLKTVK